jgi:hypothetical protein
MNTKKYILKPGKHQFAPGSHAEHHNDNLSDSEAEWYLEKYPHIKSLFEESPEVTESIQPNTKGEFINQNTINEIISTSLESAAIGVIL